MESQHWSDDQLLAYQRSQLEQLLRHARKTVPFYETRLNCVFTRHGDIDWSKWNNIPILTRKDVAENFYALQTTALPERHGRTKIAETSGSTGQPIRSTYTRLLSDVAIAADWRAHSDWGLDWSGNAVYWQKFDEHNLRRGTLHNYGAWGPPHLEISAEGKSFAIDTSLIPAQSLDSLSECKADFLFAQGNLSFALGLNLQQLGKSFPLKSIASHGVEFDQQMRSTLSAVFGAKQFSMYSSKEGGRMAHSCRACSQYHVNAETVHLEILDSNNQPCPVGVPGRVVVTTFFNAAQPYIRYEQGDIATWAASCPCGTKRPTLARIDGRVYHLFQRQNGERFAPIVFDGYRQNLDAQYWQFVQTAPNTITVKYKPHTTRDIERENKFSILLQELFNESYNVVFEIVDTLPLAKSGKFLKYQFDLK